MTHLRTMVLEEIERRNYSQATARAYISAIRQFAEYFHRSPDQLGPDQVREYQIHMVRDRKLSTARRSGADCRRCGFCSAKRLRPSSGGQTICRCPGVPPPVCRPS